MSRDDPSFVPLCAAAALLLLVVVQMMIPQPALDPVAVRVPHIAQSAPPTLRADYPAIAEQPIFAPDRAPDKSETESSSGSGDLTFIAVATAGSHTVALFKDEDGAIQRVQQGGDIGGWHLVSATREAATIERDGMTRTLPLTQGEATPITIKGGDTADSASNSNDDDSDSTDDSDQ